MNPVNPDTAMATCQDLKSTAYIDAILSYAETLLGIRLHEVKKRRYSALCPFHADTKENLIVYITKKDEVRFHCFGACKGDWDVYDLIMLRNAHPFKTAQKVWAEHLRVEDFKPCDGSSPNVPEPDETAEPDDTVVFVESKNLDQKMAAARDAAANFYNALLTANADRFKPVWDYLARQGVGREAIRDFNIGYAPPFSDARHHGRAMIGSFFPRLQKNHEAFKAFADSGLVRLLNNKSAKGYGYYCRQIDFTQKDPFLRNYGDFFSGRIVFPIYGGDGPPAGFIGRRPDTRGVRWLKQQSREIALSTSSWLYGLDKAGQYIRQYRTIILVEGIFDYFAFYNLLHDQDKTVVVSTLGSYLAPQAADIIKDFDVEHFIVAHDWDEAGRSRIERMAAKSGGWVYYLGGLAEGQDPYDMLTPVVNAISGFSLQRLKPVRHASGDRK